MVNIFLLTVQKWTESYVQLSSFLNLRHPELPVIAANRLWSGLPGVLPAEIWVSWTENCWHTSHVNGFLAFLKTCLTVEIIKLIQLIHLNKNYSEIGNSVSCENHLSTFGAKTAQGQLCVLFNLIVQWSHNVPPEGTTETAPQQGWGFSPESCGRHNPTLCQVTPARRLFGSGAARQCSGQGNIVQVVWACRHWLLMKLRSRGSAAVASSPPFFIQVHTCYFPATPSLC